jgi:hypothetical protein
MASLFRQIVYHWISRPFIQRLCKLQEETERAGIKIFEIPYHTINFRNTHITDQPCGFSKCFVFAKARKHISLNHISISVIGKTIVSLWLYIFSLFCDTTIKWTSFYAHHFNTIQLRGFSFHISEFCLLLLRSSPQLAQLFNVKFRLT